MQNVIMTTNENLYTPAQLTIAPAKVEMIVKNVLFVAIVAIIALVVNM